LFDMVSIKVFDALAAIDKAARHRGVLRHDISHELHQRDISDLGGAPTTGAGP
jgi:hypothetical protein